MRQTTIPLLWKGLQKTAFKDAQRREFIREYLGMRRDADLATLEVIPLALLDSKRLNITSVFPVN